jgi:phage shock protein PspC (stress-responsive transcriptional regulator)
MSIADELLKLQELRERGALSEAEFERAKACVLQAADAGLAPTAPAAVQAINRLRRSATDRWFGGVCGGLARASGLESWVWRLLFAVLAFFGGAGIVIYLLLWIFVPRE